MNLPPEKLELNIITTLFSFLTIFTYKEDSIVRILERLN